MPSDPATGGFVNPALWAPSVDVTGGREVEHPAVLQKRATAIQTPDYPVCHEHDPTFGRSLLVKAHQPEHLIIDLERG
jgi:hypothetical protein